MTKNVVEITEWQQVPGLVASRYKEASAIQRSIRKIAKRLPSTDYGDCFWNPETKTVWVVLGDGDDEQVHQLWHNSLKAINGIQEVKTEAEAGPYSDPAWVRIKTAEGALGVLNKPYEWAGIPSGGPSPMSNSLVTGLIGAGLGYGGGALAEYLFPERFVERGKLRRNLALLGGLGGAALHIPQGVANMQLNRSATGKPHVLRSFLGSDSQQQMHPDLLNWQAFQNGEKSGQLQMMKEATAHLPKLPGVIQRSAATFAKMAFTDSGYGSVKPVAVDSFNRAIWNDVHNGINSSQSNPYGTRGVYDDNSQVYRTPPAHAAAATGLVSGVQQMYGNRPLLSPRHFMSGLANAGVDLVTARVAGGVLGALGGLKPDAQKKLQDMGLWSGLIRGVTGSVLGLR